MEDNNKNIKPIPKKPGNSLLNKFEGNQSLLDPIIRTNSLEIPTGIYQINKIEYSSGQDTAPQGGPLQTRDNKIVKNTLNNFSEQNKYSDYIKNVKQLPFKPNKNQSINLKLPKPNINLDTFLGSGTNLI